MWHKHHPEVPSFNFDPKRHKIGEGLTIPLEDLRAWTREFKQVGFSKSQIEAKIDESAVEAFIKETERHYGRELNPQERKFAIAIFLEK